MNIYLVRHGSAVGANVDPTRPLSERGCREVQSVAGQIQVHAVKVDQFIHSTKRRAKQTAEILRKVISSEAPMIETACLSPNDEPTIIYNELQNFEENLMIVGHLPFMGRLLSLLVEGDESSCPVAFTPATAVLLEKASGSLWEITSVTTAQSVDHSDL